MSVSLTALLNPLLGTMNFNFKGSNCLYLVLKTDGPACSAPERKFSPHSGLWPRISSLFCFCYNHSGSNVGYMLEDCSWKMLGLMVFSQDFSWWKNCKATGFDHICHLLKTWQQKVPVWLTELHLTTFNNWYPNMLQVKLYFCEAVLLHKNLIHRIKKLKNKGWLG